MLNTNLLHYLESHLRVVWRFNGGFNDCRQHYTFHTKSTRPKFSILAKHFKKITPIHYLHSYHMNTHTDRQRPALITSVCIIFSPQKSMCTYVVPQQTEGSNWVQGWWENGREIFWTVHFDLLYGLIITQ